MEQANIKLVIGIISYGKLTAKYLPYFLPSLAEQTFRGYKLIAVDNSEEKDNDNIRYIKEHYPSVKIEHQGENIGFARAYNKMISSAVKMNAEYFFTLNNDIILEPEAISLMIKALDNDSALGSASPKIMRWDFINKQKTNTIDTCGIQLKPGLRFNDLGQGQVDIGQCDKAKILGPSGAAAMYRLSSLETVKQDGKYFDELMFMYKEDCDLAYRLFLAGYKSQCVNKAIIYHDRTVASKGDSNLEIALNRKNKSQQAKRWAFSGQQIIFIKHWRKQNLRNKLTIIWYEAKIIIYVLLFERYLLKEFSKLWKIKNKIK